MSELLALKFDFAGKNLQPFFDKEGGQKEFDSALKLAAIEVRTTLVKKIQKGTRSGVIYKRGGKSAQRSAPGEPPKSDRGGLVQSIGISYSFLTADINEDVNYAIFLEKGTRKMKTRPHLQTSLDETIPKINQIFDDALKRLFKL